MPLHAAAPTRNSELLVESGVDQDVQNVRAFRILSNCSSLKLVKLVKHAATSHLRVLSFLLLCRIFQDTRETVLDVAASGAKFAETALDVLGNSETTVLNNVCRTVKLSIG